MQSIRELIEAFLLTENKCQIAKWDINVKDQEVITLDEELQKFTHSFFSYECFERTGFEFKDEKRIAFAVKKIKEFIPRTLFQIKQYKNFELGDSLRRIVTGDDLYACYTSYESDNGMPLDYSDMFYVAETDEGLKIIYQMRYGVRDRQWRHTHDLDVLQVINNGELVAVEKYQPPVEATSLADYNND